MSTSVRSKTWAASTAKSQGITCHNRHDLDHEKMTDSYLKRIGFSQEEAEFIVAEPNMENLQRLLTHHLKHVPFENLDQHCHPPHEETEEIPRRKNLPSLDVSRSLEKIVFRNRGGFCFELNFSFHWLLSSLGYHARLALADVSCSQSVPGHVVILVDDLLESGSVLVDVGFGDPGVCDVLLPLEYNARNTDLHGDVFEFEKDDTDTEMHEGRFDTTLHRYRVSDPVTKEPMYRFRKDDDMDMNASEFEKGLDRVLTTSLTFTTKRICVVSTDRGHVTLGKDYIKWVEKGDSVYRKELPTETAWRNALKQHFGIVLNAEE